MGEDAGTRVPGERCSAVSIRVSLGELQISGWREGAGLLPSGTVSSNGTRPRSTGCELVGSGAGARSCKSQSRLTGSAIGAQFWWNLITQSRVAFRGAGQLLSAFLQYKFLFLGLF